jgi:hypothetical protein
VISREGKRIDFSYTRWNHNFQLMALRKRFTADVLQLRPGSESDPAQAIAVVKGICLDAYQ